MALIGKIVEYDEKRKLDRIHRTPGTVFHRKQDYRQWQETGIFAQCMWSEDIQSHQEFGQSKEAYRQVVCRACKSSKESFES